MRIGRRTLIHGSSGWSAMIADDDETYGVASTTLLEALRFLWDGRLIWRLHRDR